MTTEPKAVPEVSVSVFRFDPAVDKKGRFKTYKVPLKQDLTVLGALTYIYENLDSSLAYMYFCRKSWCRGCIAQVNGKNVATCMEKLTGDVKVEPARGFEVIRDLVVSEKRIGARTQAGAAA